MKKAFRITLPDAVFIVLLLISGIILGLSSGGFIVNFKQFGFSIFSTLQKGVSTVSTFVTDKVESVQDMFTMKKEYAELKEKLKDYEYLQRNNVEIREENQKLKEQLNFSTSLEYKNLPAQISGRDPNSLYSALTIDKGVKSGVKKGLPVIAIQDGNVGVVGKIVTVGMETSMIMPIYDTKCNISARIKTTRELGIVSGTGSEEKPLSISYISKRSLGKIQNGDVVVTSGENGNYMRDIPIGSISNIQTLDYDSSLNLDIVPIIDFSRLEMVLIVDQTMGNDRIADSDTDSATEPNPDDSQGTDSEGAEQ